jgi:RNA polymerase sigma factor (TIGR02999 family)
MGFDDRRQSPDCVTAVLNRLNLQDGWSELAPLVYAELKDLAKAHMRKERAGHILQPTALVHETFLRLARRKSIPWESRIHFYGVAGLIMRRILVDHARRRRVEQDALKITGFASADRTDEIKIDLQALDAALARLERIDPRQCQIVELRYFGGLTSKEVAEVLQVSTKTVQRDWTVARAWLHGELARSAE